MAAEGWNPERAVAAASTRGFQGTAWRVHWREVTPTDWSLSQRTSGRYHRGLDLFPPEQAFPALYTSLAPEIAIWEMVRRSAARNLAYLKNSVLSDLREPMAHVASQELVSSNGGCIAFRLPVGRYEPPIPRTAQLIELPGMLMREA